MCFLCWRMKGILTNITWLRGSACRCDWGTKAVLWETLDFIPFIFESFNHLTLKFYATDCLGQISESVQSINWRRTQNLKEMWRLYYSYKVFPFLPTSQTCALVTSEKVTRFEQGCDFWGSRWSKISFRSWKLSYTRKFRFQRCSPKVKVD